MNDESLNLKPQQPTADMIPFYLAWHDVGAKVYVKREEVYKLRPESFLGICIGIGLEDQKRFNCLPFVVFQLRITSKFEIEQMGEGFPCRDEAKAKQMLEVIQEKNDPVPRVCLAAWAGQFGFVTMTNLDFFYEELVFFVYHNPQKVGEQMSGFSLRHFRRTLGGPGKMISEEMIPTTDPSIAEQLFKEKSAKFVNESDQKPKQSEAELEAIHKSTGLKESQLLALSKAFPETVKLMQKTEKSQPKEVYDAFKRDNYALTGVMVDKLLLSQQQFEDLAKRLRNNQRNKQNGIDPIEYELVGGWFFKRYADMSPEQRREALQKLNLNPPSADAIRKICGRLKLPSIRKPGRIN
jgi:hypothetical protein